MLFAAYWAVWHFPLAGIKGYYHANVVSEGWLYSLNFIVSIFPFVILMNWLIIKPTGIFSQLLSFTLRQVISMKYLQLTPIASVYRRYYCLSCLLSLWLKNADCSLTEHWSSWYSPLNLSSKKNTIIQVLTAHWLALTESQPVFLCCSTCMIFDVIVKKLIYSFL